MILKSTLGTSSSDKLCNLRLRTIVSDKPSSTWPPKMSPFQSKMFSSESVTGCVVNWLPWSHKTQPRKVGQSGVGGGGVATIRFRRATCPCSRCWWLQMQKQYMWPSVSASTRPPAYLQVTTTLRLRQGHISLPRVAPLCHQEKDWFKDTLLKKYNFFYLRWFQVAMN